MTDQIDRLLLALGFHDSNPCWGHMRLVVAQHAPGLAATEDAPDYRLFDSQWVNVVNNAGVKDERDKTDAVYRAVKLTEAGMARNIVLASWPKTRQRDPMQG